MSLGCSAVNSGWKPLNSSVRSSAGVVRSRPMRAAARPRRRPASRRPGRVRCSAARRGCGTGCVAVTVDARCTLELMSKLHLGVAAVRDVDAADRADPHPGHPHVVADLQRGRVGEDRASTSCCCRCTAVFEIVDSSAGRQHGDDDEDQALDDRSGQRLHRTLTVVPRNAGPSSRLPHVRELLRGLARAAGHQLGDDLVLLRRVRRADAVALRQVGL